MNTEKVVFGFFVLMAATLNLGYVLGDLGTAAHHNVYTLYPAVAVNIIAMILKLGERTHIGAVHLATSVVASLQLVLACVVSVWASHVSTGGSTPAVVAIAVSMSAGALLANVVSLALLTVETVSLHRRQ